MKTENKAEESKTKLPTTLAAIISVRTFAEVFDSDSGEEDGEVEVVRLAVGIDVSLLGGLHPSIL